MVLLTKKVHYNSTIFTAEATAAVKLISSTLSNRYFAIISDSGSVLEEMCALGRKKNQITLRIVDLIPDNVIFVWVHSFMNIVGNTFADEIAGKTEQICTRWNMDNKFQIIYPGIN